MLLLAAVFLLTGAKALLAWICPFCHAHNPPAARLCGKCLRAVTWPTAPERAGPGAVVVREGIDTFIRDYNDQLPQHRFDDDAGGDPAGPLGTNYALTGLRYLVWFDLPKAFAEARTPMDSFYPSRATLVLRVLPTPESPQDIPLVAYNLTRPFVEGPGTWHRHRRWESGTTWTHAAPLLPWESAGGDFATAPSGLGTIPATGATEVYLDVTPLVAARFDQYRLTGTWFDPGMIIMRDPSQPERCRYRMIQGFQSAPSREPQRRPALVRSPELYLE